MSCDIRSICTKFQVNTITQSKVAPPLLIGLKWNKLKLKQLRVEDMEMVWLHIDVVSLQCLLSNVREHWFPEVCRLHSGHDHYVATSAGAGFTMFHAFSFQIFFLLLSKQLSLPSRIPLCKFLHGRNPCQVPFFVNDWLFVLQDSCCCFHWCLSHILLPQSQVVM